MITFPRSGRRWLCAALLILTFGSIASAQGYGRAIDGSLRWLRQQQRADGIFGKGIEDTALTLYAYATSPRKFSVSDGPWLRRGVDALLTARDRSKGSFGSARETLLAAIAIDALKSDVGAEVVEAALRSAATELKVTLPQERSMTALAEFVRTALKENLPPAEPAPEAAEALGSEVLAQRTEDGSFGDVHTTAVQVILLSRCTDAVERRAPRAERPREFSPLPPPSANYDLAHMRDKAARFLLAPEQRVGEQWGVGGSENLGITSMVIEALMSIPKEQRSPEVEKAIAQGLDTLLAAQKPDGSIHEGQVIAYTTSISMMALARSDREEHRAAVQRAREYLGVLQSDEGEGYDESHKHYGGIGYGGSERPDLSNLQLALDGLAAAGAKPDDPTIQKALYFLQRVQNHSETNSGEIHTHAGVIVSGNDGGGIYGPGDSAAGNETLPDGRLNARSYGSMTYALLKGFLYAGLGQDDERVKAAYDWITKHFTVDANPGFDVSEDPTAAQQGLFYYLHTMAKTLDLYGADQLVDARGKTHAWRKEIAARLAALQRADGSWVNEQAGRWWESNPVLATAYALQALAFCR